MHDRLHTMNRSYLVAFVLSWSLLCGCSEKATNQGVEQAPDRPFNAELELTVLVVDDSELAAAVKLLRGEWTEQSGGTLVIEEASYPGLFDQDQLDVDLIVYPSSLLAELVAKNWLRPVRESVLKNQSFVYEDLLPVVRNRVMRYGDQVFAVSLGEAPLLLAGILPDGEESAAEPMAETWLSLGERNLIATDKMELAAEFIARAAAYSDPRLREEMLFAPDTMIPRLAAPPMLRALELMWMARSAQEEAPSYQVACPTSEFLSRNEAVVFSQLPKAEQTYDSIRSNWRRSDNKSELTVLGFSGRMASVTDSTRNATSAFKLLTWMCSGEAATQISSRSPHTIWFRNSQGRKFQQWLDRPEADQLRPTVTRLLSSDSHFLLPRIPSMEKYLEVLGDTIAHGRDGETQPSEVLHSVAERWETLTDQLGREEQKRSYRYHLGLESWSD